MSAGKYLGGGWRVLGGDREGEFSDVVGKSCGPAMEETTGKKEVVVTSMKAEYIEHSIEVTHFAASGMATQGLNMPVLEEEGDVPTEMTVSVEEQDALDGSMAVTELKHSIEEKKRRRQRVYSQKFRREWLNLQDFQGWLSEGSGPDRAYCTACNKELLAGKSELLKHANGKKHKKRIAEGRENVTVATELSSVLDESGMPHVLRIVDMRSDTVTQPSRAMKEAMIDAPVGDDVFSEDPSVKVLTHCWGRGSEVIVGDQSHLHLWAQGGIAQGAGSPNVLPIRASVIFLSITTAAAASKASSLANMGVASCGHTLYFTCYQHVDDLIPTCMRTVGSIHHRSIKNLPDGTFSLQELRSLVRGDDPHWPVTTLICVENAHNMMGGKALPLQWMDDLGTLCNDLNLPLHMDGARLINASVALGTVPSCLVQSCDSVSFCLNKGLGAPMGSVIVGTKEFIARALRVRKVLGVSEEHSSAITVDLKGVQTNVVLLHCDNIRVNAKKLCQRLASVTDAESEELGEQIVVMMLPITETTARLMVHCDIKKDDIKAVIKKLKYIIQEYDNMMYLEYKISV
ncbi:low-specificity L-threonine aldolase 2-like 1 [Homarus americanus]|uniref:Low-specificity L-threonine aldolase 2-like 1 n=1 Tax=Homarus americanus TaxID=6706 RepID=A0A8J5MQ00_HOMAM|nr:low-specificity L-threonine aldolase 2-like 1 [Homarus americanus]